MRSATEKAALRRQVHAATRAGADIPENLRLLPGEPLADFLSQNGVRPGPLKLAQFRAALKLRGTPPLFVQEGRGDNATVHVKLFDPCGSASWFLLEWDGQDEAFGYVTGLGTNELGYVWLPELANVPGRFGIGMEIDTHFLPVSLGEVKQNEP